MADAMSLQDFLDASYALMAEEHQRINPLKDLLKVSSEFAPTPGRVQMKTDVATQNDQAMSLLTSALAGKQNNPLSKKARK